MKKKKISQILMILIAFVCSVLIAWYILNSLLLALGYGILIALGVMHLQNNKKKKDDLFHRLDASYNFVNLINVQMLTTNSVFEAYKSVENYIDLDFMNISSDELLEQLQEISSSYKLSSFKMYINTLVLYDNEGGNFKQMQEIPTSLCQKAKIYYTELYKNKQLKFLEITSLYSLWIAILVILQIAIPEYYQMMMKQLSYQLCMFGILILGSFLFYSAFCELFTNKIRGL